MLNLWQLDSQNKDSKFIYLAYNKYRFGVIQSEANYFCMFLRQARDMQK